MVFCNNAAIASDGTVWFSDSSRRYGIERLEGATSSRPPAPAGCCAATRTARSTIVLDGLAFANGVALAADESYVAVAESGACTVVRHWLTGEQAGTRDLLVAGAARLPRQHRPRLRRADLGDHRQPARPAGRAAPQRPDVAAPAGHPDPERLQPKPKRSVRVQAYDDAGTLVHDLDLPTDGYHIRHRRPRARRPGLAGQPARAGDRVRRPLRPVHSLTMGVLDIDRRTARPARPLRRRARDPRERDPRPADHLVRAGRRSPRPQPRRGRADHGDPPHLRLPARPGGLRHRAPGLRAQDAHRAGRATSTGCASRAG